MRIIWRRMTEWGQRLMAMFRRGGFTIALTMCLVMIGGAAYLVRSGAGAPTPAPPQATVSPVAMTPQSVDRLDAVVAREQQALLWPVSGHEILMPYSHTEPLYNKTLDLFQLHEGVDILCAPGEAVMSACDGTVISVHVDPMLGCMIEVRRDDGLIARYANLTSLQSVKHGDRVTKGQIIGSVGATAEAESLMKPHLHYAAFKDGKWAVEEEATVLTEPEHDEYAEKVE